MLGLPDGTTTSLRVAGIYPDALPLPLAVVDTSVVADHALAGVGTVLVESASPQILQAVQRDLAPTPMAVQSAASWVAGVVGFDATESVIIMIAVPVGLALLASVNLLLMSARGRKQELHILRRLGAGSYLPRILVGEALLLTLLGATLSLFVAVAVAVPLTLNPVAPSQGFFATVVIQLVPIAIVMVVALILTLAANASLVLAHHDGRESKSSG